MSPKLLLCLDFLIDRHHLNVSVSVSQAVLQMDLQWVPYLHPTGQPPLCLPDNRKPIHLQGGVVRQRQLLLHRIKPLDFEECFLQLHPAAAPDWTLVLLFPSPPTLLSSGNLLENVSCRGVRFPAKTLKWLFVLNRECRKKRGTINTCIYIPVYISQLNATCFGVLNCSVRA